MKIDNHIQQLNDATETGLRLHCEFESGWHVSTDYGSEFVSSLCVSQDIAIDTDDCKVDELIEIFGDYIEGCNPWHCERVSEWRANWTMPGYLDCGEAYSGETEIEALTALLESSESDSDTMPVWFMEALERCVAIYNSKDAPPDCKRRSLDAIVWNMPVNEIPFSPHELEANYFGDVDPIDHNGNWSKVADWKNYGYADCVNCVSAENKLWIEIGIVNKNCDISEIDDISDVADIALLQEIDHNFAHWGMEIGQSSEYTRLSDSDWFLDSDDELISKSAIEQKLVKLVDQFIKRES